MGLTKWERGTIIKNQNIPPCIELPLKGTHPVRLVGQTGLTLVVLYCGTNVFDYTILKERQLLPQNGYASPMLLGHWI